MSTSTDSAPKKRTRKAPTRRRASPKKKAAVAEQQLQDLLKKSFRTRTDEASDAVRLAIGTLTDYAQQGKVRVTGDVIQTIESIISDIDEKLSRQVDEVLHCEKFQKLEGVWRGLHHLTSNTPTDETLKIKVMNVQKAELERALRRFKGAAWDQSPIFKKIYEEEFGQFGGDPFGVLIGDYEFDQTPSDVGLLTQIAKIASASHCPFIAAASPKTLQMDSWSELGNPRDISKIFTAPEYAAWRRLRESHDSRYISLTMPRFMARHPYGKKTNPVDGFDYEEAVDPIDSENFCWANAAYAMGVNITRAFKNYGWCTQIRGVESGGAVEHLPTHFFPSDDGGLDLACPTEIAISDRRENELSEAGFIPLVFRKNSDYAAFIGARTLNRPDRYEDDDATANAELSSRLPYIFATCRFAHYLKCIVRDKIGSFKSKEEMQVWLNDWLMNYVDGDPSISTDFAKAKRPLSAAQVVVEEIPDNPGFYRSQFYLRPHYQLEGLTVSLRLVSKLPSGKQDQR